jgi:DNA-nicking Smr family endonuclease
MREMLAEGPVEGNQQQANISNISASWTEVVNHSKHKKLVKDLHTLFPDCDGEFLEDVYMSMEKDMDKTIEYLTQSMNLIMSSKASKILPRDSAVLPRPKPADSSSKAQSSKGDADLHYTECRENAERFDAMMRVCFEQASLAFSSGNGKAAKELSNQGKQYLVQRNEWQRKAAQQTCAKMNSERTSYFPLDMHGLRVDEGLQILKELIKSLAKVPGKKTLHIITGQGKHSQGGVGKLKISIEAFLDERNLYYTVPDHNPGELYIYLDKGRKYIS